ncbi:hypothetical protein MNV_180001 [Candidatus Methanoperedens nitroreducens]|uniref:Uncharacterized protein n=1 Tax=Candidatus Methanoperedens nitratireducens TaxID=1392998 RepID=A0A284VMD0_9EURY|nr:hypothetical protein MNV_180001 [Candidatus Methanoperedens nitroreducens]
MNKNEKREEWAGGESVRQRMVDWFCLGWLTMNIFKRLGAIEI